MAKQPLDKKQTSRRRWWRDGKKAESEASYVISEEELLNRVLLAKALIAYCGNQTVHFKTDKETLEISPSIARDLLRKAGRRIGEG